MAIQENKPFTYSIDKYMFPIGCKNIDIIFDNLIKEKKGMDNFLLEQEEIMLNNNPHAFKYLLEVSKLYTGDSLEFRFGISLNYKVMQRKMGNMPIPKLTEAFIENYQSMQRDHIINTYGKIQEYVSLQAEREQITRIGLFKMIEPVCFEDLDFNFVQGSNYHIFSQPLVGGFVFSYFLFRSGLSDIANYTEQTSV